MSHTQSPSGSGDLERRLFRIGIDVGGTFTDLVALRDGEVPRYFKTPSIPDDPALAVVAGLRDVARSYGFLLEELLGSTEIIVHGTTVATNTLVERKGAKVGLITTEGFRDLLEMREGLKEDRYNLRMAPVEPLVPRYLRLGVPERVRSNGAVETPLDEEALDRALEQLRSEGAEALAVCFLFSYLNPAHELRVAEKVAAAFPDTFTSLSHQVLPQIKEFDRLSTTALNSYVGPVFARYLRRLKEGLANLGGDGDVLIMQSNGGVAPIDDSIPLAVKAILSGPAGGVSGATFCGQLAGESRIIGLDMGGTSTDISMAEDGVPSVTTEKFEEGWKIAVPAIDVQTLGAGGGSIARVDPGGILHVGPDSTGADPGPACYGRGGAEATVTDASLVLGYLDPDNFLGGREPLSPDLAARALDRRVAGDLGLSPVEAAHGVHRVVSTTIAEGIRLMAARRGVDPREYTLLAFGGASGLHAAAAARQLRISKVYLPAAAPVLSAYGMLSTDLRYDLSRSHPASLDGIDLGAVLAILDELEAAGREKLRAQGVSDDDVYILRSADMRYLDQIYEVNVLFPDASGGDDALLRDWASNLHARYEELYSYRQSDQEVRLVTLRVSVLGRLPRPAPVAHRRDGEPSDALKGRRRVFLGEWEEVPVYRIADLPTGKAVHGPALLESDFTTLLADRGDVATADRHGGIALAVAVEAPPGGRRPPAETEESDPVTMAVVESRLDSIAQEMMEVMLRTSMSQILNSSRDFSTAILDVDCQLVAQGEGIPVHTSALPLAGESIRDYFGDEIAEGDLYALNDPYFGASHLPDITVIMPVFYEGELVFYAVNRAHHSDIGGGTYGGYNADATEIYQEGLRIPPLKIYDRGAPRRDLLQMLAANVRHPENFLGDLNAQIGSVKIAARRVRPLLESYGPEGLKRVIDQVLKAAETQVREIISGWPDGVYRGESIIDDDGFEHKMIPIRATVTIQGDTMTVDLSESSRQVTGFINSAYANTRSIVHAAMMYLAPSDLPKNEGSMRPVKVVAPRGLIVNASPPAPVCMSTNHCAEEIVEAVFRALAPAVPHTVSAASGRRLRYAITGTDPRTGRQYIWHFFMGRPGGGASHGADGWSNVGEINAPGAIRSPSVEVTEERFPFFIARHEMRPGSAGDGKWRGGLGAVCELVYEGADGATLNTAGDGIVVPPLGMFGGGPGTPHTYTLLSNGAERVLRSKETGVVVRPGDRILCLSAGGGGYGDPARRSESDHRSDVRNGYVGRGGPSRGQEDR